MIMAKDMRALAEQKQETNANQWWAEYKEIVVDAIRKAATKEKFELTIHLKDSLNKDGFIDNQRLREKVIKELGHLGYEVDFLSGYYLSDGEDAKLKIKW